MRRLPRCLVPALALALAGAGSAVAGEVTIYRCTDADGHLTLRDTPCAKGQKQQSRAMLRPVDPPPRPRAPATARADRTPPAAQRPQIVVVTAPRPLYECVTADGERYTSETDDGNPRWVPLATLGYPVYPYPRDPRGGPYRDGYGVGGRIEYRDDHLRGRVEFGDPPGGDGRGMPRGGPRPRPPLAMAPIYPAGTWLRDACSPLPQQEVCDRLRDRRYDLDRRYNSALQSERTQITYEQRNIDARLSTDCGAY